MPRGPIDPGDAPHGERAAIAVAGRIGGRRSILFVQGPSPHGIAVARHIGIEEVEGILRPLERGNLGRLAGGDVGCQLAIDIQQPQFLDRPTLRVVVNAVKVIPRESVDHARGAIQGGIEYVDDVLAAGGIDHEFCVIIAVDPRPKTALPGLIAVAVMPLNVEPSDLRVGSRRATSTRAAA